MSYEVTITIETPEEHVAYVSRLAAVASQLFGLDGSGVKTDISVEQNRDGVERVYEFLSWDTDAWTPQREVKRGQHESTR